MRAMISGDPHRRFPPRLLPAPCGPRRAGLLGPLLIRSRRNDALTFRMHPRHAVRLHGRLAHEVQGWERYALVENVGLCGARVVVDEPLSPGDAVSLAVTASTLWEPLVVRARVRWVESGETGRHAGLLLQHRSRDGVMSWYELIARR